MSDDESIQFVDNDNESIQFEDLEGTTRSVSTVGRRSRGASMRRFGTGSVNQQQQRPTPAGGVAPHKPDSTRGFEDNESIAFFEDNQSVASSAPGNWFVTSSRQESPVGASLLKSNALAGGAGVGGRKRGTSFVRDGSSQRVVLTSDEEQDDVAALDRRLAKIAALHDRNGNNLSFTNRSIQFTTLASSSNDEADDPAPPPAAVAATKQPLTQPQATVNSLGEFTLRAAADTVQPSSVAALDVASNASGTKKTVVSNALRQRGASMQQGLRRGGPSSQRSATSTPRGANTRTTSDSDSSPSTPSNRYVLPTTTTTQQQGSNTPVNELSAKKQSNTNPALAVSNTQQTAAALPSVAIPISELLRPTFPSLQVADSEQAPRGTPPGQGKPTPSSQHPRTDSSQLVLEHLRDQETRNIFVQHKAILLSSPTIAAASAVAMAAPTLQQGMLVESEDDIVVVDSNAAVAQKKPIASKDSLRRHQEGTLEEVRGRQRVQGATGVITRARSLGPDTHRPVRTSNTASASIIPGRRRAASASMSIDLIEAERMTNDVRRFNAKQYQDLQALDERLQQALLNKSNSSWLLPAVLDPPAGAGAGSNRRTGSQQLQQRLGSKASSASYQQTHRTRNDSTSNRDHQQLQQRPTFEEAAATLKLIAEHATMQRSSQQQQTWQPNPVAVVVERRAPLQTVHATVGNTLAPPPSTPPPTTTKRSSAASDNAAILKRTIQQVADTLHVVAPSLEGFRAWERAFPSSNSSSGLMHAVRKQQHNLHNIADQHTTQPLFFKTGVRLTESQVRQFLLLVRDRLRGGGDAHEQRAAASLHHTGGCGQGATTALSRSHQSHTMPTMLTENHTNAHTRVSTTAGNNAMHTRAVPAPKRQRTEAIRSLFDLMDVSGGGVLRRGELSALKRLLLAECQGSHGGPLYSASAHSRHRIANAFASSPPSALTQAGVSSSQSSSLHHGKFRCRGQEEFVTMCRAAVHVVIPCLEASAMDGFQEWEFAHVGMLLSKLRARGDASLEPYLEMLCA